MTLTRELSAESASLAAAVYVIELACVEYPTFSAVRRPDANPPVISVRPVWVELTQGARTLAFECQATVVRVDG